MEEWLPDSGIKMSGKMAGNKESMVFLFNTRQFGHAGSCAHRRIGQRTSGENVRPLQAKSTQFSFLSKICCKTPNKFRF